MGTLDREHTNAGPVGPESSIGLNASNLLRRSARDSDPVDGLTHNFYRYPARFSPRFVRTVIEEFSEVRELVFDPFMGGGTTLVEAMALGRQAVGTDISSLATFVSEVKTTVLTDEDLQALVSVRRLRESDESVRRFPPCTG